MRRVSRTKSGPATPLGATEPLTHSGVRPLAYARTSFSYAIRCGWSASAPFRRFRSSMYDW